MAFPPIEATALKSTSFEEVQARMKALSAYGTNLAGNREEWSYDAATNVWKPKGLDTKGAQLRNVIFCGKDIEVAPDARIFNATIGPHVHIGENTLISNTRVRGHDWDDAAISPINRALHWPPRRTVLSHCDIVDSNEVGASILRFANVFKARGVEASIIDFGTVANGGKASWSLIETDGRVLNGAEAVNSIVEQHGLVSDPGTLADATTVTEESQLLNGIETRGCLLKNKAVVSQSGRRLHDEIVDCDNYKAPAGSGRPCPQKVPTRGATALAGRPFTRAVVQPEQEAALRAELSEALLAA